VRAVLEKSGYVVHPQVGDSGFRIDLGVLAPDPKHGYLLGIECDGATYHSDRSARLRDVWRERILRERGWRFYRIWSTRWWYHRGEEIDKLKAALDDALTRLEKPPDRRESWQMTLAEWRKIRAELQACGDVEGLRGIGGLGTEYAHRYRVEQALKQGKPVPPDVLKDYPDLLEPPTA
jgi:hypothetical protein